MCQRTVDTVRTIGMNSTPFYASCHMGHEKNILCSHSSSLVPVGEDGTAGSFPWMRGSETLLYSAALD